MIHTFLQYFLLFEFTTVSEPFLESIPQIHILLVILSQTLTNSSHELVVGKSRSDQILFWTTFSLSVFSATFGIAKFLKVGPCCLVSSHGPLGGLGSIGFLTLMLNIASTLLLKGILLVLSGFYSDPNMQYNTFKEIFVSGMMYSVPIIYGSSLVYVRKMILCIIAQKNISNKYFFHFRVWYVFH